MALIPGGTYGVELDSLEGNILDRHEVSVPPFCLDITEVTVGSYKACVEGGACTEPNPQSATRNDSMCNWKNPGRGLHPINCVDWYQASSYCRSAGKRLPSEYEWEWAVRNGDEGTKYPWGDSPPNPALVNACGDECWPSLPAKLGYHWKALEALGDGPLYPGEDGFLETAPVGSFPKGDNRWGVHDLTGNVLEWTSTRGKGWHEQFAVVGGCFKSSAIGAEGLDGTRGRLRFSRPGFAPPSDRSYILGFRCAR